MTTKERLIRALEALPEAATIADAIEELHRLEHGGNVVSATGAAAETAGPPPASDTASSPWDLLESLTGALQAPADWASEHDHYLYGSPKRSNTA